MIGAVGRFVAVRRRIPRTALVFAALALALTVAASAEGPRPAGSPAAQRWPGAVRELAPGKFLVAARNLPDPNFANTVVLLVDYSAEGAMGVIINRRTDVPLSKVFPGISSVRGDGARLYFGGPVAVTGVLALLRADRPPEGSRTVLPDVHIISTREPLERTIAATTDPNRLRVYLGYAGWGPRQLDNETAEGVWHVFAADADVVFDDDPDTVWRRQIRRTEELLVRSRIRLGSG